MKVNGMKRHQAHASGHCSMEEIFDVVNEINPKKVFPVHTEEPELFKGAVKPKVALPKIKKKLRRAILRENFLFPIKVIICEVVEMAAGGKKAVLIIAHKNFRDEEFLRPKEILEKNGVEVTVASSAMGPARGMLGVVVEPDMLVGDINVSDYDAVVFIGGSGSSEFFDNQTAHSIAQQAAASGKLLGAICIAPSTLANAEILVGRRATSYPSEEGNLKSKGAIFTGTGVETDGKIITADGPSSAEQFGQALIDALK